MQCFNLRDIRGREFKRRLDKTQRLQNAEPEPDEVIIAFIQRKPGGIPAQLLNSLSDKGRFAKTSGSGNDRQPDIRQWA
jgi:hypothetical protein